MWELFTGIAWYRQIIYKVMCKKEKKKNNLFLRKRFPKTFVPVMDQSATSLQLDH